MKHDPFISGLTHPGILTGDIRCHPNEEKKGRSIPGRRWSYAWVPEKNSARLSERCRRRDVASGVWGSGVAMNRRILEITGDKTDSGQEKAGRRYTGLIVGFSVPR